MPNAMSLESAQPWWKGAVIYQIYPRSYQDTNGDGVGRIDINNRPHHIRGRIRIRMGMALAI